jgi:hypothetical protein
MWKSVLRLWHLGRLWRYHAIWRRKRVAHVFRRRARARTRARRRHVQPGASVVGAAAGARRHVQFLRTCPILASQPYMVVQIVTPLEKSDRDPCKNA